MSAATTRIETSIGPVRLAASEAGLCKVVLPGERPGEYAGWLARHVGGAANGSSSSVLREATSQLQAYLNGKLRAFDLPLDLRGTAFQKQVWEAVAGIPYGQTATYGQLAAQIGRPQAARAVGAANGANPLPVVIPCHRVVGSDGSLCGYGGGLPLKRELLHLEQAI